MQLSSLAKAAKAKFPRFSDEAKRKGWLDDACHSLKHEENGATDPPLRNN